MVLAGAALALAACATTPPGAAGEAAANPYAAAVKPVNDPLEPVNRAVHALNDVLRRYLIAPVARVYNSKAFAPVRIPLSNALDNLNAPVVFVNDMAQGRFCAAQMTLDRFLVNSTFGLGGAMDLAGTEPGLAGHDNSFAQTFAIWGLLPGPYLELPVLGPSNFRGLAGTAVDWFLDPADIALSAAGAGAAVTPRDGLSLFDEQAGLVDKYDRLENSSLDGYVALRSTVRQIEANYSDVPACPKTLSDRPPRVSRSGRDL